MAERGDDFSLALEPGETIGIGGERFRQDLQRDIELQASVARAIDLSHAPGAEGGHNFIRADARAGRKWHQRAGGL
jgi:hypothetical protein